MLKVLMIFDLEGIKEIAAPMTAGMKSKHMYNSGCINHDHLMDHCCRVACLLPFH
jgi:hypothetical protein